MPNIFENTLMIYGENVEEFVQENSSEDNDLDFNKSVPMPQEVKNNVSEFYSFQQILDPNNPINWCSKNWGTKWSPRDVKISNCIISSSNFHITSVTYTFETANSPPFQWLMKTSQKYPKISFGMYYEDEDGDFKGNIMFYEGKAYKPKKTSESKN